MKTAPTLSVSDEGATGVLHAGVPLPAGSTLADSAPRDFQPLRGFVLFLVLLSCLYQIVALISSREFTVFSNFAGPSALGLACIYVAYRLVSVNPSMIWTPIPPFLAACALYFGFGPLVYIFGDDATLADLDGAWTIDENMLWQTNVLNAVGILVVVLVFLAGIHHIDKFVPDQMASVRQGPFRHASARTAALVFLGIGIPIKYLFVLPFQFGLLDFVLPGAVGGLVMLVPLGVMMVGYHSVRKGQPWTAAFVGLVTFEACVDFLRFTKLELLMGIILAGLGRYLGTKKARDLIVLGVVLLPVYFWLSPIVLLCRSEIAKRTGNVYYASLPERLDVFWTALDSGGVKESDLAYFERAWWARCCYANMQAYCMEAYDANLPGQSLSSVFLAFIPRLLWPDKPDLALDGEDFTELVFGHRDSFTGMGVFGEAYWNGGYGMVVLVCAGVGLLFVWLSRLALGVMHDEKWLFLPCVFIGMRMGFRIDGWILVDYVGPALIIVGYYVILSFLSRSLVSQEIPMQTVG